LVPEDRIRRGLAVDLAWSAIGAQVRAGHEPIDRILDREYASDKQLLDVVIRAASAPGTTFTSGWANELISSVTAAWAPSLTPSVFSALVPRAGLSLDFTQGPIPSIPSRSATPTASGAFVLEGGAIPVK